MRFLFLFLLLMFPITSQAQDTGAHISGAYLQEVCERVKGKEKVKGGHATCQAYIAGLIDYHHLLRSLGTAPSIDICVPNTAKLRDIQDIVWKYLKDHPDHAAFNAAPAVGLALFEVFPCEGAKKLTPIPQN